MAYKSWLIGELIIEERITSFLSNIDTLTEDLLWRIGKDVRDDASKEAPKDTHALSESISVTTDKRSDYWQRIGIAQRLRPEARIAPKSMPPRNAVDIHAPVHYASFVELGTRFMNMQPYMLPALADLAEKLRIRFDVTYREFLPGLTVRREIIK